MVTDAIRIDAGWNRGIKQAKEEIEREKRSSKSVVSYLCKVGMHRECGGFACGCGCHAQELVV